MGGSTLELTKRENIQELFLCGLRTIWGVRSAEIQRIIGEQSAWEEVLNAKKVEGVKSHFYS